MGTVKNGLQTRNIVITIVIIVVIALVVKALKKEPDGQAKAEQKKTVSASEKEPATTVGRTQPVKSAQNKPIQPKKIVPKVKLDDVIHAAQNWEPAFKSYRGMPAPDLTITDLNGQVHRLSQYKGKNVMLIFWAPWCGPCKAEVPHLVELRKSIPEKDLAMIAISYLAPHVNTKDMIRRFVLKNNNINYKVAAVDINTVSKPYNLVDLIPCNFFIDQAGKIKLATRGMMPISDIKAVLQAQ